MRNLCIIILFSLFTASVYSQETTTGKRGTIKVRKTGQLVKVQYDNVNYRLVGIDRYGNVLDTAVVEFKMSVSINGVFYTFNAIGSGLSAEMRAVIEKNLGETQLFFKKIKAKDRYGTLIDMPNFEYTYGKWYK